MVAGPHNMIITHFPSEFNQPINAQDEPMGISGVHCGAEQNPVDAEGGGGVQAANPQDHRPKPSGPACGVVWQGIGLGLIISARPYAD